MKPGTRVVGIGNGHQTLEHGKVVMTSNGLNLVEFDRPHGLNYKRLLPPGEDPTRCLWVADHNLEEE